MCCDVSLVGNLNCSTGNLGRADGHVVLGHELSACALHHNTILGRRAVVAGRYYRRLAGGAHERTALDDNLVTGGNGQVRRSAAHGSGRLVHIAGLHDCGIHIDPAADFQRHARETCDLRARACALRYRRIAGRIDLDVLRRRHGRAVVRRERARHGNCRRRCGRIGRLADIHIARHGRDLCVINCHIACARALGVDRHVVGREQLGARVDRNATVGCRDGDVGLASGGGRNRLAPDRLHKAVLDRDVALRVVDRHVAVASDDRRLRLGNRGSRIRARKRDVTGCCASRDRHSLVGVNGRAVQNRDGLASRQGDVLIDGLERGGVLHRYIGCGIEGDLARRLDGLRRGSGHRAGREFRSVGRRRGRTIADDDATARLRLDIDVVVGKKLRVLLDLDIAGSSVDVDVGTAVCRSNRRTLDGLDYTILDRYAAILVLNGHLAVLRVDCRIVDGCVRAGERYPASAGRGDRHRLVGLHDHFVLNGDRAG